MLPFSDFGLDLQSWELQPYLTSRQAKFKVPRNLQSSAEWSSLKRPPLHVVLVIAWGYGEFYFIMPSHVPKDSSMECTLISKVLEMLRAQVPAHLALPEHLLVSADNTTREAKNTTFASYLAYLTGAGMFRSTECHYLTSGHSHNSVDQRFSTCSAILARAPTLEDCSFCIICLFNTSSPLNSVGVLQHREVKGGCGHCQDPGEFCECLKSQLKPIHGVLHVEQLHTTFDFRSWFFKAGISLTGLAASHHEPHATHAWHFQRRGALLSNVLCQNSDWLPLEPQAGTGMSKHTIYETI